MVQIFNVESPRFGNRRTQHSNRLEGLQLALHQKLNRPEPPVALLKLVSFVVSRELRDRRSMLNGLIPYSEFGLEPTFLPLSGSQKRAAIIQPDFM